MTGKDFAILRVGQVSPGMTSPLPGMNAPGPGTSTRPGQISGQPARQARRAADGERARRSGMGTNPRPGGIGGAGTQMGAVRGVVSTSTDSSLRVWKGRTRYDQWEVSIEDLTPRVFGAQTPQPGTEPAARRSRTVAVRARCGPGSRRHNCLATRPAARSGVQGGNRVVVPLRL